MRFTTLELTVLEAAMRDLDPAHFEVYSSQKEEKAFNRALQKINEELDRRVKKKE